MEATKPPQLKRKAREISKDDPSTKIGGKLFHELREIHQACKKAKTFETQKVVKKLKSLRKDADKATEVADHEAQLNALKDLDIRPVGNTAFKTKILKDHTLKENELVKTALDKEIQTNVLAPAPSNTPLAKVQARLLSSKLLANQIQLSLDGLKSVLDPELKNKKVKTESGDQPKKDTVSSAQASSSKRQTKNSSVEKGGKGEEEEDSDDERLDELSDSEHENADGWESGSVDNVPEGPGTWQSGSDLSGSEEEDEEDTDDDSEGEQPKAKTPSAKSKDPKGKAKATESMFLPSLAVGFVSGSEDSDIEGDVAEIAEPRKNRRGQRARRAIWEKKYGAGAKHKQAEAKAGGSGNSSSKFGNGKQGSYGQSNGGGSNSRFQNKGSSGRSGPRPLTSGSNTEQLQGARVFGQAQHGTRPLSAHASNSAPPHNAQKTSAPATASKALHPSWEAKKKLKEKEMNMMVPSQGKKIKF